MTMVNASCPNCGDVRAPGEAFTLNHWPSSPELSTYEFTCPKCGELVVKPAALEVGRLLGLASGVTVNTHTVTVPLEALEVHAGPPITLDDLIDLHEWMGAL